MCETWVQSLGQEGPLEKTMGSHSSIHVWRISQTYRSLVGYSPWGCKKSKMTGQLTHTSWLGKMHPKLCRGKPHLLFHYSYSSKLSSKSLYMT